MRIVDYDMLGAPIYDPLVNGGQNPTPDGGVDQKREAGLIFGAAS
jgi:hypothetical protein